MENESFVSQARHVSDFLNADPPVSKSTWMGWFNRKNKIISQCEDETVCKTKTKNKTKIVMSDEQKLFENAAFW